MNGVNPPPKPELLQFPIAEDVQKAGNEQFTHRLSSFSGGDLSYRERKPQTSAKRITFAGGPVLTDRSRVASAVLLAAVSLVISSCSTPTDNTSTRAVSPSSDRPMSPYPTFESKWDSAIPLSGPEQEAAEFAAETEVLNDNFLLSKEFDPDLMRRYNERVTPTYIASRLMWTGSNGKGSATGGMLWRITHVDAADTGYRVTLCVFDTPGLYNVFDGKAVPPDNIDRTRLAETLVVNRTSLPSAADRKAEAPSPRLLVTSFTNSVNYSQTPGVLCDKFAPDPFIQSPPSPLPTPSGGK